MEVKGKVLQAVMLKAERGLRDSEIANEIGVAPATVKKWFTDSTVKDALAKEIGIVRDSYRSELGSRARKSYTKALNVMENQLDSENEWVSQAAARDILNRFQSIVVGEESQEVVVRIEGMPEIGMAKNDAEEGGE